MAIDNDSLGRLLQTASAQLQADRARALADSHLPSGLAFLTLPLLQAFAQHPDQDEVADHLRDLVGAAQRRELRAALADPDTALRALQPETPLAVACQTLLDAVSDPAQRPQLAALQGITAGPGSVVRDNKQIRVAPGGVFVEAVDHERRRQEQALIGALNELCGLCDALALAMIDAQEATNQRPMSLEHVYITLEIERTIREKPADTRNERERRLTVLEALHAARVLLLGAPGSGKSTVLNHLALCLGRALLADLRDDPAGRDAALARLPGWELGALLPVRIILRDLAAFPAPKKVKSGSLAHLLAFLEQQVLGAHHAALPLILERLTNGTAILLFDGLDEVVGDAVLAQVTGCIAAAQRSYPQALVLATCRTLDYESNPQRHLPGLAVERLAPLRKEQIDQFIDAWYAELRVTNRRMLGTPQQLQAAVQARPELRTLADSPLLLTMIAVVHAGRGELPDSRAKLYDECIDLLLVRWRSTRDGADLLERGGLPNFGRTDLLRLMARIGFEAHEEAARQPDDRRPSDLSGERVRSLLRDGLQARVRNDPEALDRVVSRVLHALATRNGLLLKRSSEPDERFAFPHRSFQEYLAAVHIAGADDYDRLVRERARHIHWHETLRLLAGYRVFVAERLADPIHLARELLARSAGEQALAGEMLALIGAERAAADRPYLLEAGGLWSQAAEQLQALSTNTAPDSPATLRVRAGLALGSLRYGRSDLLARPDAWAALPDPRLLDVQTGTPADYWCDIAPGPFWFGNDRKEQLKQIAMPHAYRIARFVVTNAEYARFLAANGPDGYDFARDWWPEAGRTYIANEGRRVPYLWSDPRFTNPLQPVVGVTWWEATAYCCWLTTLGHTQSWLPPDAELRLPTWIEWERAARHTAPRPFPWGDAQPDPECANYKDTGIGAPSPIGCFPRGLAACGAHDMAGNVLEWTATPYQQPEQVKPEKDFTPVQGVVISWSSCVDSSELMFCGTRFRYSPYIGDFIQGFRVMWSLALGV